MISWLRATVGVMLLIPGVGCTTCCAPFDQCGPLCNGECGCGCPSTMRAGGYSSQMVSYEEVMPSRAPRLAPTPAPPRTPELTTPETDTREPTFTPMPEPESPGDTETDAPFEFPETDTTTPGAEDEIPDTMPDTDTDAGIPDFDPGIPNE